MILMLILPQSIFHGVGIKMGKKHREIEIGEEIHLALKSAAGNDICKCSIKLVGIKSLPRIYKDQVDTIPEFQVIDEEGKKVAIITCQYP